MDDGVLAFVTRCLKCPHYNSGRCEKYNRLMDEAVMDGKRPECDGTPYKRRDR